MNAERTPIEAARNRLATNHYMEWEYAGGPHPCKHGVAAGIPCKRCDKELVDCEEPSESAVEDEYPQLAKTERGFSRLDFTDRYGVKCSLQKSSLATEDCIWLGCNDANPRHLSLVAGEGWEPVAMPSDYIANTRMHLTQEQVANLLPYLIAFANTGDLSAVEPAVPLAGVPRFSIEFHRGVYFSTPELGTCEVVRASDYDAALAAQSVRDRDIWDLIDKTQSCTSGKSSAECLEWIKEQVRVSQNEKLNECK